MAKKIEIGQVYNIAGLKTNSGEKVEVEVIALVNVTEDGALYNVRQTNGNNAGYETQVLACNLKNISNGKSGLRFGCNMRGKIAKDWGK